MDQFGSTISLIKIIDGANYDAVKEKIHSAYKELWDFWDGGFIKGIELVRLDKAYFSKLGGSLKQGNKRSVNILFIVAAVLLLSAVFNYVNLSVAQTGVRAKEMATRRLLGSSRSAILWRYLTEALLFTFVCFIIGYIFSEALISFVEKALATKISIPFGGTLAVAYLALIVLVATASGLFPALAVSKFKPVDVVKGSFRFKSKMTFSKVLIVAQCVISIVFIVVAMTLTMQMRYMMNMPKGLNQKNIMTIITPFRSGNPNSAISGVFRVAPFRKEGRSCKWRPLPRDQWAVCYPS